MELLDYTGLSEHKIKYDEQLSGIVADVYDNTSTYSVGEYVIHYESNDNKLYRCITDIAEAEDWTESHWIQVDVTDEIDKTDHNVDLITDAEETYGPGSIVTFESESDGLPIRKITSDFSPVQDLHGYDHPWPGGGSKNLIPGLEDLTFWNTEGYLKADGTITISGNPYRTCDYIDVIANTTYAYSSYGPGGLNQWKGVLLYDADKNPLSSTFAESGRANLIITIPENAVYMRLYSSANSGSYVQLELGSTATAYEPYENICQISGWTETKITNVAKNIFGGVALKDALLETNSTATAQGNDVTFKAVNELRTTLFSKFKPSTQYTIILRVSRETSSNYPNIVFEYTDGSTGTFTIPTEHTVETTVVFTTAANKSVKCLRNQPHVYQFMTIYADRCGIFEGVVTADDFVAYQEQTLPISWQDEAGTIYGGTLTLNENGSVDLMQDVKTITMTGYDSFSWSIYNNNKFSMFLSSSVNNISSGGLQTSNYFSFDGDTSNPNDMCFGIFNSGSYTYIRFRYDILENSVDNWINWLKSKSDAGNPLQITIKLKTPENYHFQSIMQLTTFLGTNNIFTTLNGDTTVTVGKYISTITSHIDGTKSAILSLIAKDESSGIASTNYVANQFITMNGKFYRITTNVASGATFVIGTNCVETTVGSQITALLNA